MSRTIRLANNRIANARIDLYQASTVGLEFTALATQSSTAGQSLRLTSDGEAETLTGRKYS